MEPKIQMSGAKKKHIRLALLRSMQGMIKIGPEKILADAI
jgi:hypothetical protein